MHLSHLAETWIFITLSSRPSSICQSGKVNVIFEFRIRTRSYAMAPLDRFAQSCSRHCKMHTHRTFPRRIIALGLPRTARTACYDACHYRCRCIYMRACVCVCVHIYIHVHTSGMFKVFARAKDNRKEGQPKYILSFVRVPARLSNTILPAISFRSSL